MENKSVSALALIVSNSVPLFGVWFLGWDLSLIMFLYWLENVVIGILNVFKIINARGPQVPAQAKPDDVAMNKFGKWSLAGFFLLHYGIFTFVHGIFVFVLFGLPKMPLTSLLIPFASLLLSHIFSYFTNYLGEGEYLKNSPDVFFMQPYSRVIILHLTIIFSAFFIIGVAGSKTIPILLLVVFKTVVDLASHLKEHQKLRRIPSI
jgi:hypothetical protein